jgi:replication-associated recombination protein RarA
MKLFNRLGGLFKEVDRDSFKNIDGYDDVKEIVRRALNTDEQYNLVFIGAPASGKTLFLQAILDMSKDVVYFDMSNTTNKILDILEQRHPKIILLDEIEKAPRQWQEKILNLLESGRVDVEQQKKSYHFEIKGIKVFATCNDISRLSKPLQSRFRKIFLPKYSEEAFLNVAEKVLPKTSASIARYIGSKVYQSNGDIRDVLSVGRLIQKSDGPEEVGRIMNTLMKYGKEEAEEAD